MNAGFTVDAGVLLGGLLLLVGVLASGLAARARVPSLLLFIGLGILVADEGLGLIRFDDAALAQNIAAVALVIILFEGGLGTEPAVFRVAGVPAFLLATLGVVVTAGVVALGAIVVLGWEAESAFLLGAVVSSTDAAAVFAALRSESLPERTSRILQLESGMNDPVAVLLTVGMVEVWRGDPSPADWVWFLGTQLAVGAVVGIAVGVLAQRFVVRASSAVSSLGVISLAIAAVSYGAAAVAGGSGFLSVYLTGVLLAASDRRVRGVIVFHEGLAATAQGVLFLLLGILVFPSEVVDDLPTAAVVAAVLVLVARPVAVVASLVWFRIPIRRLAVMSWAGLRGAVPVVLATIPFTAGHPDGSTIFDVAFVVVVLSVAIQAPTVGPLARRLGVEDRNRRPILPVEIVPVDAHDADLVEIEVPVGSRVGGSTLAEASLPGGARVAVIHREGQTIVPKGSTQILAGDVLLMVIPRDAPLADVDQWCARIES